MKKIMVIVCMMIALSVMAYASPLPNGTLLGIDAGTGSAPNIPCDTGSCFGMAQGPGMVIWTDFAPGTDGGIVVGKDQLPGSTVGGWEMGELSDAWVFFGAPGTFATSAFCGASAGCVTTTSSANTFDNASWHVSWNGVVFPVGMSPSCLSADPSNCIGVTQMAYSTGTAAVGSTYQLDYAWAVPDGDPSGFGNVPFYLILRGTIGTSGNCTGVECWTGQTCDPMTGNCLGPNPCDSITCSAPPVCKLNICNPYSGDCVLGNRNNGTGCNDGNSSTTNDVCTNGVCAGTPTELTVKIPGKTLSEVQVIFPAAHL